MDKIYLDGLKIIEWIKFIFMVCKSISSIGEIEKRVSPQYEYSKLKDANKGIYASKTDKRNHKPYISEMDLQNKFDAQMQSKILAIITPLRRCHFYCDRHYLWNRNKIF